MKLRDYQVAAINSLYDYFGKNSGNPVLALPTGTGKSVIIAGFIQSVYKAYPNQRIMMLTHVKELIEQNFSKLMTIWKNAPAGIYSAGVGRKDTYAQITFAGIQSVAKKASIFGHIDLVIIDECHLVSPNNATNYQKFINSLKTRNPNLKVIGLSATPYRLGLGMITDGGIFTDICYDITTMDQFNRLVNEGYLAPLVSKRTSSQLDVSNVRVQGGEFVNSALQVAVDKDEITRGALEEALRLGEDRRHWLVFATGIDHAEHITEHLKQMGISAAVVHSKLTLNERNQILADYKAGKIRALVNNNVLTTGFDFPAIDLIIMLRPTQSPGLWVQMLGRGTRPVYADGFDLTTAEGRLTAISNSQKQDCLVLDFAGNTERLGPVNDPVIPRKRGLKKGGTAPVRCCPECMTYCHASVKVCPSCGFNYPENVKIAVQASTAPLMAQAEEPLVETFDVNNVCYSLHYKQGSAAILKVTYQCGLRTFHKYVCIGHSNTFAARQALLWWTRHWDEGKAPYHQPLTSEEAINYIDCLRTPKKLNIWINKKYPEIMSEDFEG